MRTARQVLAERAALSRLRVAARAYAVAIRKAESAVALVDLEGQLDDTMSADQAKERQRAAKRSVNESKAASERLEAAALAFAERSPAPRRRTRRRK